MPHLKELNGTKTGSVVVCGLGPTMNVATVQALRDKGFLVCGVNDFRKFGIEPDFLVIVDKSAQFKEERRAWIEGATCPVYTQHQEKDLVLNAGAERIALTLNQQRGVKSFDPKTLNISLDSPFVAIQVCAHLGFTEIVVIGVDAMADHHLFKVRNELKLNYNALNSECKRRGINLFSLADPNGVTSPFRRYKMHAPLAVPKVQNRMVFPQAPKRIVTPDAPGIPKRMFFFFAGPKLSWMRYMTLYTFKKLNPSWDVILYLNDTNTNSVDWKNNKQDFNNASGDDYMGRLPELSITVMKPDWPEEYQEWASKVNPVHESDLFRLFELWRNGGYYCDTDVLWFRPMDRLHASLKGYDAMYHEYPAFNSAHQYWATSGFLACTKGNQYWKDIFDKGMKEYNASDYQGCGAHLFYRTLGVNRYDRMSDALSKKYPQHRFKNISTELIYHHDWQAVVAAWSTGNKVESFPNEAIGYHWFGGTADSQKYNAVLNENNFREYLTTLTVIADEVVTRPKVSIVTGYHNRRPQFLETLKSIERSEVKDIEVIAVDDGSNDANRIEILQNRFPFLKVIRLEAKDKWWRNPCVPFNIGIKAAKGDIILLQNPECKHHSDILSHVVNNVNDDNYISYCTYALQPGETEKPNKFDNGRWYTHQIHRPAYFHFCAALTKFNMDKLNGFDERFAPGFDWDDNEIVERIKRLGVKLIITDETDLALHQHHDSFFYSKPEALQLSGENKVRLKTLTEKERSPRVNIGTSYLISFKDGEGRADNLRAQLDYLENIMDRDAELIIIEQDATSKLDWLKTHNLWFCINHIFVKNAGIFNKGRGYNIGVKAARGEKLVFTDCDVILERKMYPEALALLDEYDVVNPYKAITYLDKCETDDFIVRKFSTPLPRTIENSIISGGVFMMRKDKYIELKGFDEDVFGWGAEDSIFDQKIEKMGLKIYNQNGMPGVHLWHPNTSAGGDTRKLNTNDPYYSNITRNHKMFEEYFLMTKEDIEKKINAVKTWGI